MSHSVSSPTSRLPTRSLGLKLIVILALILLMAIPVMFISIISYDRSSRADEVTREVSQTYGGAQTVMGPIIVVPYQQQLSRGRLIMGDYIISAENGEAIFDNVSVSEKSRSLYKVPVFAAKGHISAQFASLTDHLDKAEGLTFFPEQAKIIVGLSDVTGLQSDLTLSGSGQTITFEPYQAAQYNRFNSAYAVSESRIEAASDFEGPEISYNRLDRSGLTFLSAPLPSPLVDEGGEVSVAISLTGAPSLALLPFARSTQFSLSSDWPHPSFEGRFPPAQRDITDAGFSAQWGVPYLRRGMPAAGVATDMYSLTHGGNAMGVAFVSPLNPYQTVNRALKYAVLFIGLVFLSYFLMETLLNVRVHPAQYLLIGLAQAVFYLLLLAFAERIGFTLSFAISAVGTVGLTALYAGAVFGRGFIAIAAGIFGAVYGLLFVLMRIQDFALMVGALVCFIAIAATLYLTRNLDWYGGRGDNLPAQKEG